MLRGCLMSELALSLFPLVCLAILAGVLIPVAMGCGS